MKETQIFQCLLCRKFRNVNLLEKLFDDGSPLCKICGNDIRSGFCYYIDGKEAIPCTTCNGVGYIDKTCILPYQCNKCPNKGDCKNKCPDCNGVGYKIKT